MLSVRFNPWWRRFVLFGVLSLIALAAVAVLSVRPQPASANPLADIESISAGESHSCAVVDGAAMCWGDNTNAQLGDGTTTDRNVPTLVTGLGSGITAVSAGGQHSCALTTAGGVKCWGRNNAGQLGDGTTTLSTAPVDVAGLTSGVTAIAAGWSHSCAALAAGGMKCWGANNIGQLGDGTTVDRPLPASVAGLPGAVSEIAASVFHTCARTSAGAALCWGNNAHGQLGNGSTTNSSSPVSVSSLASGVAAISAGSAGVGESTCALTTGGGVKCWGRNQFGQLGTPTGSACGSPCSTTPVDVTGLSSGVAAIGAGGYNACAGLNAGGVQCWGSAYGSVPDDVPGLSAAVTQVTRGTDHACALLASGTGARCWGTNGNGELGTGAFISTSVPLDVVELVVKPTPTPTPCPPSGCPTPEPPPVCASEACMALAVRNASGDIICRSDGDAKCSIALDGDITLVVLATKPPAGGYVLAQVYINYGSVLTYKAAPAPADETTWPDSSFSIRGFHPNAVNVGALTGLVTPLPVSFFVGGIFEFALTCTSAPSSSDVELLPYLDPEAFTDGALYVEASSNGPQITPQVGSLTINCVEQAVGGVALDGELRGIAARDGNALWLWAALAFGAIVTLSAFAFARRRHAVSW